AVPGPPSRGPGSGALTPPFERDTTPPDSQRRLILQASRTRSRPGPLAGHLSARAPAAAAALAGQTGRAPLAHERCPTGDNVATWELRNADPAGGVRLRAITQ